MKIIHVLFLFLFFISCAEESEEDTTEGVTVVAEELMDFDFLDYTNNPVNFQIKGNRNQSFQEVRFYRNNECKRGEEIFIASDNQIKDGISLNLGFLIEEESSEIYYSVFSSKNSVKCSLISVINYDNDSVLIAPNFSESDKEIEGRTIKGDSIFLKGSLDSLGIESVSKEDFYKLNIYSNEDFIGSVLIEDYLNGVDFQIKENVLNELKMKFSDLAGNESLFSESFSFISDNIKPISPSVNKYFNNGDVVGRRFIIAGEGSYSSDFSSIRIYHNENIIAQINPSDFYDKGYVYESLVFGIQRFNVVSVDSVGNESIPVEFFVSVESVIPEIPLSIKLQGDSLGNNPNPIIQVVGTELDSVVGIFSDPFCSQKLGETYVENNTERITLNLPRTSLYRFYVKVFKGKFESICLDSFEEYFFDNRPARFPDEVNLISPVGVGGKEEIMEFNLVGLDVNDFIYFFEGENCSSGFLRKEQILSSSQNFSIDLNEGNNIVSFYVANAIGNTSSCSSNYEYYKDTTAPLDPIITRTFPLDSIGNSNIINYSISNIEENSLVKLSLDNCSTFYKEEKGINSESLNLTSDGVYNVSVQLQDDYGNISSCIAPLSYQRDTTAPIAPIDFLISNPIGGISNQADVTFSINYQENGLVKIYDNFTCSNVVASTNSNSILIENLVSVDGSYNYYITIEDDYGNISSCLDYGVSYQYDTSLPDFTVDFLSDNSYIFLDNLINFSFSGTCENGIINYSIDGISNTISCVNSIWSLEVDFSSYQDKIINLSFSQESLAGNVKEIDISLTKDLTPPEFPDAQLDPSWDGSISDPFIYFSNIESLATVYLYNNPTCSGDSVSGVENNGELVLRKEDEGAGTYSLSYKVEDFLGNISSCSTNTIDFSISNFVYIFYQKVGSIEGIWKRRGSTDILIVQDVKEFVLLDKKVFYVKNNKIFSYDGRDHVELSLPNSYYEKLQLYNDKIFYACEDSILGVELCYFDKDLNLTYFQEIDSGQTSGFPNSSFPIVKSFSDNLIVVESYSSIYLNDEIVKNTSSKSYILLDINTGLITRSLRDSRSLTTFKNNVFYIDDGFPFDKYYYDLINENEQRITNDIQINLYYAPSEFLLFGTNLFLYYSKGYGEKELRRYSINSDQRVFSIDFEIQIKDLIEDGSSLYFSANLSDQSKFYLYYFASGVPNVIIYDSLYLEDVTNLTLNQNDNIVFFAKHNNEYKFFELNKNTNEATEISTGYDSSEGKIYEYELRK